jgi:glutathione synthase/RimK-type ligase-like ATP-grasp enzyme
MPRFAVLVPAPDFPEPWRWAFDVEAAVLAESGATIDAVPWTDAGDLRGYDLILPLVAWGYHERYNEWLASLDRLERERLPIVNPAPLLRWNGDKSYLAELARKGVATVPTITVEVCDDHALAEARQAFGSGRLVVKPPVSASATGTYLLEPGDELPGGTRGRPAIIQPMIETIATEGEYALMLFDGVFSHTVLKRPRPGDFRVQPHLGGTTVACSPPAGGEELAKAALAAAPAPASYARVDMIRGSDGALMIMELELIEPALFLELSPDGGAAFARAIARATRRAKALPPNRKAS